MLSVSSLIDFLMNLLRDPHAQGEFAQDPQGVLSKHGLDGLCGQDVADAAPLLGDQEHVHAKAGHPTYHDDPVRAIHELTRHYEVHEPPVVHNSYNEYHVDHHETFVVGDGNTVVQDSFNTHNVGVDNTGGVINDSTVAGHDVAGSLNTLQADNHSLTDSLNGNDLSTHVDDHGVDHSFDGNTVDHYAADGLGHPDDTLGPAPHPGGAELGSEAGHGAELTAAH